MPANPDSILDSVKKVIGFDPDYTAFDLDIVMSINAAIGSLLQLGVGPGAGFFVSDNTTLWSSYISGLDILGMVKTYIFLKVKLVFDPPDSRFALPAIESQIQQLEWRINSMIESNLPVSYGFWWDLTGLSDFPSAAAIGDFGFDSSTGDVWRKDP